MKTPMRANEISRIREQLFSNGPEAFASLVGKMESDGKLSMGVLRPWAWFIEPVRGCNLRCGFCATRLFPINEYHFMTMETWRQSLNIIGKITPFCRIEFCNAGEPTLHPKFIDIIKMTRELVPMSQILVYTNGTTLMDGRVTYMDMFEAGLNMVFVDMYADRSRHVELARKSGYEFFEKRNISKEGRTNVFSYRANPSIRMIQLSEHPGEWSKAKVSSCGFSTFLNHLDWEAASKYGIKPVVNPPKRRCQQVFSYVNICWDGEYVFCCFDFMRETAGTLGNVSDGIDGFLRFWFGKYMQDCRRHLHIKDRAGHEKCNRCSFAANRCDIPRWTLDLLDHWWDGKWHRFEGMPIAEMEERRLEKIGLGLLPKVRKK